MTTLDLSANGLGGRLPSEVGLLTNLATLRMNGNSLSGVLPSEIGLATNLATLYVGSNYGPPRILALPRMQSPPPPNPNPVDVQ